MKFWPALMLPVTSVLLWPQDADARKAREIIRDCSASYGVVGRSWEVEEIGTSLLLTWLLTTEERSLIHSFVWLTNSDEVAAYLAHTGKPGVSDTIFLAPMKPLPAEGAWLTLQGDGEVIGPVYYGHHIHGRSAVEVPRDTFLRMTGGAKDLNIIVQAQDGFVLYEETLPLESLREMEAQMLPLLEQVVNDRNDRENRCSEPIVIVD